MKKYITIAVAVLSLVLGASATEINYASLQEDAKQRLAVALKSGKSGDVSACAATLDALARARYLDNASEITEAVKPLITGFSPQIAALPDGIKKIVATYIQNDPTATPLMAQLVTQFLQANDAAAAREALGDLVPVIEQIKATERSGENRFQSGAVLIRKDEDPAAQAIQAAVDKQVEAVEQAAKQASEAARK